MIEIYMNGTMQMIEKNLSLTELLKHQGIESTQGFAVAINQNFIPRSLYATTFLQAHDRIEIVSPMQGG